MAVLSYHAASAIRITVLKSLGYCTRGSSVRHQTAHKFLTLARYFGTIIVRKAKNMKTLLFLVKVMPFCFFAGIVSAQNISTDLAPYKDAELSIEERVSDLLPRLTIEEKAHQLASFFPNANVRLGIPHMQAGEALHGICLPRGTSFPMAIALAGTWDPDIRMSEKLDL